MPARELETTSIAEETEIAEVAPEPAEAAAQVAAEGEVPAVVDASASPEMQSASEKAFAEQAPVGDPKHLDEGLHEPEEYRAACIAAGEPGRWDDKYLAGHTSAKQFHQPYESKGNFTLKRYSSASQAVRDFVTGPTIADYRVIGVAMEMDMLRDEMGDHKFDRLFGSKNTDTDASIPHAQRLQINAGMYTVPFVAQMRAIADAADQPEKAPEPVKPEVAQAQTEEKPKAAASKEPDPVAIAQELGVEQEDRAHV